MSHSNRRRVLRLGMLAVGAAALAGAALAQETGKPRKVYVCPPCGCAADGKEFPAPGACPECGMPLIEKTPAPKRSGV